jgi:hypothetical protein
VTSGVLSQEKDQGISDGWYMRKLSAIHGIHRDQQHVRSRGFLKTIW